MFLWKYAQNPTMIAFMGSFLWASTMSHESSYWIGLSAYIHALELLILLQFWLWKVCFYICYYGSMRLKINKFYIFSFRLALEAACTNKVTQTHTYIWLPRWICLGKRILYISMIVLLYFLLQSIYNSISVWYAYHITNTFMWLC